MTFPYLHVSFFNATTITTTTRILLAFTITILVLKILSKERHPLLKFPYLKGGKKKKKKRKRKIAKLVPVMFSSGYCRNRCHPRGAWRRNALFAETILPFASRPQRKGASSSRREEDATRGKTEEEEDYVTPLAGRGRGNRSLLNLGKTGGEKKEEKEEEEGSAG